jgi:hypothetical protein
MPLPKSIGKPLATRHCHDGSIPAWKEHDVLCNTACCSLHQVAQISSRRPVHRETNCRAWDATVVLTSGYASPAYARSLVAAGQGAHLVLPSSGGQLLVQSIDAGPWRDAHGPYPLFDCCEPTNLPDDLAASDADLVSVVVVPDPLRVWDQDRLRQAFPDLLRPYKSHACIELRQELRFSRHHRRRIRQAAALPVQRLAAPIGWLDEWCRLYTELGWRHRLTAAARLNRESFRILLQQAWCIAYTVTDFSGMVLWLTCNDRVYYHLAAYDQRGYEQGTAYACFAQAIEDFRASGYRIIDLGGVPDNQDAVGLARFKRGWANSQRIAHLAGRIGQPAVYRRLVSATSDWFPAYRSPARTIGEESA